MGIQIANAETAPEIAFDRVHLLSMNVSQELYTDDTMTPKYRVAVEYTLYGVNEGTRYYEPGNTAKSVIISDYLPVAMAAAGEGDMTLLLALGGIEQAVATILATQAGLVISAVTQ